ncbi:hypothetical protein WICPIJ_005842 [Wickerhamomyces pijperi]|uniref:Uncharacterized protein n=1 Tax=Wickerhamomyces pijperi TaxID=599730 RepID=A0A9P8Q3A9_WICPI|nr:hypothetical protein WICPIJ_005842 [Wickerhamomyces pijperi]
MYATSVRAFQKSAVRMSAAAPATNPVVQWVGYFAGITGVCLIGAGILHKMNEENDIKKAFQRHNINNINGTN